MTKTKPPTTLAEVEEQLDLFWGVCPAGSPKYQAREKAKRFYHQSILDILEGLRGKELKNQPKGGYGALDMSFNSGYNQKVSELNKRIDEVIGKR
jgi:hypothetical protein